MKVELKINEQRAEWMWNYKLMNKRHSTCRITNYSIKFPVDVELQINEQHV